MLYYIVYLLYICMYSTPAKNILTKCTGAKDFPTRFFVQMGLSVPSAGAANFDNTPCRT